ncbi:MAG TPA: hypothetical protein VNS32_05430 [Flavisolibacter sp.]|nr:hypothetical protein [Flavisolibacter sp.]
MASQNTLQQNIKVIESHVQNAKSVELHVTSTQAMPDDRVLITLDDGRSFVIDADQFDLQTDDTYQIVLHTSDQQWAIHD